MASWRKRMSDPDPLVPLDDGRLRVRASQRDTLAAIGWTTFADAIARPLDDEVCDRRRADGWENVHGRLGGRIVFLKRHADPDSGPIEAAGVAACEAAGVPAMTVLAVGSDGMRSLLLTAGVGDGTSVFDALADRSQSAEPILAAAADTLARLHAAGLSHSDGTLNHYLLDGPDDSPIARLIDLQGYRTGGARSRAWKDLGSVRTSLMRLGRHRELAPLWWRLYADARAACGAPLASWHRVGMTLRADARLAKTALRHGLRGRLGTVARLAKNRVA